MDCGSASAPVQQAGARSRSRAAVRESALAITGNGLMCALATADGREGPAFLVFGISSCYISRSCGAGAAQVMQRQRCRHPPGCSDRAFRSREDVMCSAVRALVEERAQRTIELSSDNALRMSLWRWCGFRKNLAQSC